ncbi:MAG: peptidyl-prolyl cis-trans isomerase [Kiritimatiellae bacterium]|nr:peptidyl-prolyl cis-trans isomerase [Kiritimatiellia bacterium]
MNTLVAIETSLGTMKAELYADKAPATVANFLAYADEGFYDGTVFHRVIPGFMVQGGGFTPGMEQKKTKAPIKNEARNGLSNERGTLAMARTSVVDSATCQFFVNHQDNAFLDFSAPTAQGWGYAVFGKLVDGYDVLDRIAAVPTGRAGYYENVPKTPVVILSVKRVQP